MKLVLRSNNKAVNENIPSMDKQGLLGAADLRGNSTETAHEATGEGHNKERVSSLRWLQTLKRFCTLHKAEHKYNPLSHPAVCSVEEEDEKDGLELSCCEQQKSHKGPQMQANELTDETRISADLLQIGDVVRVAPNEVFPADSLLLVP